MTEIVKKLEVYTIKTSAFHLQTNGQTEQFNRILINILSIYECTSEGLEYIFIIHIICLLNQCTQQY
jgi:hypothetical protein